MSQLLFIAVPGGVRGDGTAILRLVVVPRLDDGTMADNGLTSWPPAQLRDPLPVTFTPDGGTPTTIEITPRLSDHDGLWAQVFAGATISAPVHRDLADTIAVTPTSQYATHIGSSYQVVAQAYATAAAADPQPGFAAYSALAAYSAAAGDQLDTWAPPPIGLAPPAPLDSPPAPLDTPPAPPVPPPPGDANRTYGMLREHPTVLAALGLILELDVPLAAVPAGPAGVVRVDWPAATAVVPALPPVVASATAYLRDAFLPAPHVDDQHPVSDLDQGMVCLDDTTRWQLAAVDVESGVQRLAAAADSGPNSSIARFHGDATTPTVTNALPALRTAGVLLLRIRREEDFAYRRSRSFAIAADDDPILYAEDLVLGYRIDVRESDDTRWYPLCTREATYRINGTVVGTAGAVEEGHVKANSAHRDDTGRLLADEVVTRWDGWSLAVPRPFPPPLAAGGANPDHPYQLDTEFSVPAGSLPLLRFGSSYQLRARVADLAGGGLGADADADADNSTADNSNPADPDADLHASPAYLFQRFEPVSPPALLLPEGADADDLGPGVHVAQLVITSEGGDPAATTVDPVAPAQMRRLLTRPTVSLTTAEWHGALSGDGDATWAVAQLAIAGQLPDPATDGVAAAVVPEPGGPVVDPVQQSWPAWPDTTAGAIELHPSVPGSGTPVLSWDAGQLTVSLAPGQDVAVQVSSTIAAADVGGLAVSGWSADAGAAGMSDVGLAAVTTGQHPMVTPATMLRCVHAVRRPLLNPSGELTVSRAAGAVPVLITPSVPLCGVDPASTGQVEVTASWTEITDDLRSAPTAVPVSTALADVPVQSLVVHPGDTDFARQIQHHLPDTRHRDIAYTATAVSRFRSYFPDSTDDSCTATPLTCTVDVPNSARPAPPKIASVVPAFVWQQTLGPTITRTRLGNRIRVELERPWFDSGEDERLALVMAALDVEPDTSNTTQAGRDPIFITPGCEQWPSASAVAGSGDPPARVVTVDATTVDAMPAEVFYDPDVGRWFADFTLAGVAGASYSPLLRPAFARYQRHSVAGCELSAVVLGDFVPVLPDRTLTVTVEGTPDGSQLTVTVLLAGVQPDGSLLNGVNAVIERGNAAADLTAVGLNSQTVGWFAVPQFEQQGVVGQPIVFTIPFVETADLSAYRLRVRELEQSTVVPDPGDSYSAPPVMGTLGEVGRVVFSDIVPLEWSAPAAAHASSDRSSH